jgi:hypothetical protein
MAGRGGSVVDVRGSHQKSAGEFVEDLSSNFPDWIRRRVDNVYFESDRSIRREIELHLDLSKHSNTKLLDHKHFSANDIPLPLLHLNRSERSSFTVRTRDGSRVPFANMQLERRLVADALAQKYVKQGSVETAAEQIFNLIEPLPPVPISYTPGTRRLLEAAMDNHGGSRLTRVTLSAAAIDRTMIDDAADDIAKWQESYLLVALIPRTALTDGACVMTITYVQSVAADLNNLVLTALKWLRRITAGTMSWGARFPIDDHRAESQHVNTFAPADYTMIETSLKVSKDDGTYRWITDDDLLPTGGHVFWKMEHDHSEGLLGVKIFAPRSNGMLPESFLFSVTVVLTLSLFTKAFSDRHFDYEQFDPNFAAATLLLIPAVVISILTYRESSRVAAHATALARFTLVVQAVAIAACASPFAFKMVAHQAEHAWYSAYFVAMAACARQIVCCIFHWFQMTKVFSVVARVRKRVQSQNQEDISKAITNKRKRKSRS